MSARPPRGAGRPLFAIAFVASLHLLTLPMTWLGTDQGEMVFAAQRLVEHGTLTLADDGRMPVPEVPWVPHRAGEPVRSRLHPGTPVVLAPFVLLDRALGYRDPLREGRVVYLQGLICVAATLALLGFWLQALGAPAEAATMAILFVGTSFPLWTISRSGGAEPIVALLLTACAGASQLALLRGTPESFLAARALCLLLLPWVHPTGLALTPVLAGAELLRPGARHGAAARVAAAGLLGCAGFSVLWNHGYHGHWLAGGYAQVGGLRVFDTNPLYGAWTLARDLLREAPIAIALPILVALRAGGRSLAAWRLPALALGAILALFATLYEREAVRRFAPVMPLLGLPLGLGWSSLGWPLDRSRLLVFASIAWGLQRLLAVMGAYYPGPDGLFYPAIFWVKLAIDDGWSASWALPVAGLALALVVLWRRIFPAGS